MVSASHEGLRGHRFDMVTVAPLSETVAAIAIIVLAIIGLAGTAPGAMVAIATIVIGAAILLQGANMATEYGELLAAEEGGLGNPAAVGGGITLEFLAGGTGVVLGILALLTPITAVLSAAALVVFGCTLLLSASATARASEKHSEGAALSGSARALLHQTASVGAGAQIMIGVAAVVLGILALVGLHGVVLTLVGELAIGAALLAVGAGNSVAGLWRHA